MRRWIAAVLVAALTACVSADKPPARTGTESPDSPGLREEGILLLMADRRYYDSFSVGSIRFENPELAPMLAVSLGRIGDAQGLPALQALLVEGKPEVRREAAFALGMIADPSSVRHLLAALTDTDTETAVWAVAALAELEVDLERVVAGLASQPRPMQWQRLSPYLFRFPSAKKVDLAAQGLSSDSHEVHAMAAFALARNPQLEALDILRSLLGDPDPWVRGWAARALGLVGDRTDLNRLRPLLEDRQPGPTIQALRAARRLVSSGMAAAPPDWRPRLAALMQDSRSGVAVTAIETAAAWLLDEVLGDSLEGIVETGTPRQREVALLALAQGGDTRAVDYATRGVALSDGRSRALSATVAAQLGDLEILQYLSVDEEPVVRGAALAGLMQVDPDDGRQRILRGLEDEDPGVRAQVVEWLVDRPVAAADRISRAIVGPGNREVTELRLYGIRALVARAIAEPLERGLVVENLESLARVGQYPARVAAAEGLVELGRPEPRIGVAGAQRTTSTYMQVVFQTDKEQIVEIATRHGEIRLRLDCEAARMTCLNFLQLARQGFYDGQVFHRVIPDFMVQSGDPRGDGWGGPGYTIRDELSRTRFERGVLGMAKSAPDTGGSQFFITLSRQPHLDGRYTAFGRVVHGEQVLDRLEQGDRLERVVVVR